MVLFCKIALVIHCTLSSGMNEIVYFLWNGLGETALWGVAFIDAKLGTFCGVTWAKHGTFYGLV